MIQNFEREKILVNLANGVCQKLLVQKFLFQKNKAFGICILNGIDGIISLKTTLKQPLSYPNVSLDVRVPSVEIFSVNVCISKLLNSTVDGVVLCGTAFPHRGIITFSISVFSCGMLKAITSLRKKQSGHMILWMVMVTNIMEICGEALLAWLDHWRLFCTPWMGVGYARLSAL